MARRRTRSIAALALLAAAGLWPVAALGDLLSLRLDPIIGLTQTRMDDGGLRVQNLETLSVNNRVRLGLSLAPYPTLRVTGTLFLDDLRAWSRPEGQPETYQQGQRWTGSLQAAFGNNFLGGVLGYLRQETSAESTGTVRAGTVRESYDGRLTLRPADLPTASLAVQHTDQYSTPGRQSERITNELRFDTTYDPNRTLSLRYGYRVERAEERAGDLVNLDQAHFARVGWNDTFLENRLNAAASYNAGLRLTSVTAGAAGSTVITQALPAGGLSKTLAFSDTQERVTLLGNPGLVDAVLASSAGIDLGWGRTAAGDTALRATGAELAPIVDQPAVNLIYVWVDQRLPPEVVAALAWTAWESTDNLTWTPVPITGGVIFGELDSRFEIPVRASTARFLRVDARPLPLGVTTDQRYSNILVSEVQFMVVKNLPQGTTNTDALSGRFAGSLRALLLRSPDLVYSLGTYISHSNHPLAAIWSITNGLSFGHRLSPTVTVSAQVQRTDDGGQGRAHNASDSWGASLGWDPIPTAGASANYSGQLLEAATGTTLSHSINLNGRADLYRGVGLFASTTGATSSAPSSRVNRSTSFATGLNLVPNQALYATVNYNVFYSDASGGALPSVEVRGSRVDASAAFNPFPALSLSAWVSRVLTVTGSFPSNQASFTGSFSPFRDGALQLRTGYLVTLDTSNDTRTRNGSASLRWIWRGGAHFELSFIDSATLTPTIDTYTRSLFANLALPLL